jgi:hypothetical protein
MFLLLLVALLLAAGMHIAYARPTLRRGGEIVMVYVLAGYCGIPMLLVSGFSILRPDLTAAHLGFPGGSPFQSFVAVALLGMGTMATMSAWFRGRFLVAPAVCWTVFFAGATIIHLADYGHRGALTHGSALLIFATHGLIAVLLLGSLVLSGAWREPARA